MKVCRKCKECKPEGKFRKTYIKKVGKYYLRSECKKCQNKTRNNQRKTNGKDKLNKHRREYYKKNAKRMNKQRQIRRKINN